MSNLNALAIQEALKQVKAINIPWLQHTFSVNYSTAKEMMAELERRGWVVRSTDGRSWRVYPSRLCLRRLAPEETEALCEGITTDCISALERLREAAGTGVTKTMLERAVRGATDTEEAIRALRKLKLLYHHKGMYYSCISVRENWALTCAARQYMRSSSARGKRDDEAEKEEFRRLLWMAADDVEDADDDEDDDD